MTNTDPEMVRIVARSLTLFDTVKRVQGWTDDDFRVALHGTGCDRPFGLIPAEKPELYQVACPRCSAVQEVEKLPADCRECARRFHKTGPIRRTPRT